MFLQFYWKSDNSLKESGFFILKSDSSQIALVGAGGIQIDSYIVGESKVSKLDMKGKKIEGAIEAHYVLKKAE